MIAPQLYDYFFLFKDLFSAWGLLSCWWHIHLWGRQLEEFLFDYIIGRDQDLLAWKTAGNFRQNWRLSETRVDLNGCGHRRHLGWLESGVVFSIYTITDKHKFVFSIMSVPPHSLHRYSISSTNLELEPKIRVSVASHWKTSLESVLILENIVFSSLSLQ